MEVTNNSPFSGTTSSSGAGQGSMDYDAFLKLLLAEMKNQDPTAPTDASEYVAQFANFSQVEQAMAMNEKLDWMLSQMALSQAEGLIGSEITSEDGKITGVVESVRIINGGAVAELENGEKVLLGPGIIIHGKPDETGGTGGDTGGTEGDTEA